MATLDDLRRRPPGAALAALSQQLAPGSRIAGVRRLRGGISMAMHAVTLVQPDGGRWQFVLRRYLHDHQQESRAAVCEREWQTLGLLATTGVPAPEPLWHDREGRLFGDPALVMSHLPGRGHLAPHDLPRWCTELATALAAVHAVPLPPAATFLRDRTAQVDALLREHRRNGARSELEERLWGGLLTARPGVAPSVPVLLHGDYWAGNTLWQRGRITAVVDWEDAGRGARGWDVSGCRLDLSLMMGPDAAALFLDAYEAATGLHVADLPFWDLAAATHPLPDPADWLPGYHDLGRTNLTPELLRQRFRQFVEEALSRLRNGVSVSAS